MSLIFDPILPTQAKRSVIGMNRIWGRGETWNLRQPFIIDLKWTLDVLDTWNHFTYACSPMSCCLTQQPTAAQLKRQLKTRSNIKWNYSIYEVSNIFMTCARFSPPSLVLIPYLPSFYSHSCNKSLTVGKENCWKKDLVIFLIKVLKRMSIVQNAEKENVIAIIFIVYSV